MVLNRRSIKNLIKLMKSEGVATFRIVVEDGGVLEVSFGPAQVPLELSITSPEEPAVPPLSDRALLGLPEL